MDEATGLSRRLLGYLLERAPHWQDFQAQLRRVGGCEHPIRVTGRKDLVDTTTGEVTEVWSSADLPDGTVLVACGNRRASRCGPCSRLYQGDAYQLIVAGLRGGKGTPETVAGHPALFATLTAPSFGPVHTRVLNPAGQVRPCHRGDGRCVHGRPVGCGARHEPGDPLLGQAVCGDCFDYEAAVLFNAHVSELWRRTRIDVYRQLAKLLDRTERQVKEEVRVEYVKVAEYQRRGLLHYHAAIRLDHAEDRAFPPTGEYTADLLADAIRAAVAHVEAPYPKAFVRALVPIDGHGQSTAGGTDGDHDQAEAVVPLVRSRRLRPLDLTDRPGLHAARWGQQLHVNPIVPDTPAERDQEVVGPLSRGQVAGYLAKYATKHTEALGGLDRRVRPADLEALAVNRHVHALVVTSLLLGMRVPALGRLHRWAHQLGYGGHWLTKSRRWSTTFTALRKARADFNQRHNPDAGHDQDHDHDHDQDTEVVAHWTYVASGYRLPGDVTQADMMREEIDHARTEYRYQLQDEKEQAGIAA